jgi:hypothetical protein
MKRIKALSKRLDVAEIFPNRYNLVTGKGARMTTLPARLL